MPSSRVQKGTSASNDCQWYEGCGVRSPSPRSFGGTFNAAGGGWYALERTDSFIKVSSTLLTPMRAVLIAIAGMVLVAAGRLGAGRRA